MSEALLGVLIGGAIGIVGTTLQLWHSSRQQKRDRLMQLRRDVFLGVAEGLAAAQQSLFRFANTNIPFDKLGEFESRPPGWANKLSLVASIETIEAHSKADELLGSGYFDLLRRRNLLQQADDHIGVVRQQLDQLNGFQQQMKELVERLAADIPNEQSVARAEWAARNVKEVQDRIAELVPVLAAGVDRRWELQRDVFRAAIEHYRAYQRALAPALVALRREIELPIDFRRYERLVVAHGDHVDYVITKMLDEVTQDEDKLSPPAG